MFQATTTEIFVEVKTGGSEGTNRNPEVAIWREDGTELACQRYWDSNYDDIAVGYIGLTPGIGITSRWTIIPAAMAALLFAWTMLWTMIFLRGPKPFLTPADGDPLTGNTQP
ncbi:MAG: hypothetical protein R2751_01555 [Bacteroidales bacterium]